MGFCLKKVDIKPTKNQSVETIRLSSEVKSIIYAIVKNENNEPVENAVVMLFEAEKKELLKPISHTFTDEAGCFLFGPLDTEKNYVLKIWANDVKCEEACNEESDTQKKSKTLSSCAGNK